MGDTKPDEPSDGGLDPGGPETLSLLARRFGIGDEELRAVIARVGSDPAAIEAYLEGASSAH